MKAKGFQAKGGKRRPVSIVKTPMDSMATMSYMYSSGQTNRPVKEFYLNGDNDLRSDRLSPLTKPRSISRQNQKDSDNVLEDDAGDLNHSAFREFDLEKDSVFDIQELAPLKTKQFANLEAYPYVFESDRDVLCWASALLSESPVALSLLHEADKTGWKLALNDLGTGGFHLAAAEKIIELDNFGLDASALGQSAFFRNSLVCILAKALREIWHENRWGAFETDYKAEAVLLLERARAADADSVSILVGWDLRSAGYNEIWRHILGSDDGDMAQVLINILERYPTALYNGMALAHVFRQWYADISRVDALDHTTLEQVDFNLRDASIALGDKDIVAKNFETLSTLPDGTVYLKELGSTVARDPFFCGLNDPINQAHLFQIVYDSKVTYVDGIPFRDDKLARKFFSAD